MASALSLVSGVEAPSGGDAGPSSAVPSFWGLHEFDAFLLVVDGVPWGGAFNPAITTLDFTDVQRVEILKGSAPVMYGATSFVGVVQAVHYTAGQAADEAELAYGSYGSTRWSISSALPSVAGYRQSFALDGQHLGFSDAREVVSNEGLLYRGELDLGVGKLRLDGDISIIRDIPPSPVIRDGNALTTLTPINANFNPADAKIDEHKYHFAAGYSERTPIGVWESLASFAYSEVTDIRAFLHPDLSGVADTQNQRRYIEDGYFDTHLAHEIPAGTTIIVGADILYGLGRQTTLNGNSAYMVPLDGSVLPPPTTDLPVNEIGKISDRRIFAGQYLQFDSKIGSRWDLLGGVRFNEAYEYKESSDLTLPPPELLSEDVGKTMVRPAETLGLSYRLMAGHKDINEAVAYLDFRNAFKPSAIDFGPDYTPDLLSPETAHSFEAGLKGSMDNGRLSYQAEGFLMIFNNLVVPTNTGELVNAAQEKLNGEECEVRFQVAPDLALVANGSYHDAYFAQYLFFNGVTSVNVAGRQLPLSPHVLSSMGLLYAPNKGFGFTFVTAYVGRRFLDEENIGPVGGYLKFDATLSYSFGRYQVALAGTNLTNQRPPVSASEFGSQSYYLLAARMIWLSIRCKW